VIGVVLAYLACSVGAYLVHRRYCRWLYGTWTVGERRFTLIVAVTGPIGFLAMLLDAMDEPNFYGDPNDEAKW
jgi:hypothetical protein